MANTRNANLDDQKRRRARAAYNRRKNELEDLAKSYNDAASNNKIEIDECDNLMSLAESVRSSLETTTSNLNATNSWATDGRGLVIHGSSPVSDATEKNISSIGNYISIIDSFVLAVTAEKNLLIGEKRGNEEKANYYSVQASNLSLSDFM